MSFYIEKVVRKKGTRYRIVKDYTYQGKRTREYFSLPSGTTKAQAEMIRVQMDLEANFGNYITKPSILFKDYAENIYFEKYTDFLSPSTRHHYKQLFHAPDGIAVHLGDRYLSEITTEVVQDMVNHYASLNLASKTIRNYVNLVSVILKRAKVDNYLKRDIPNPCDYVIMPKSQSKEGNVYSMEQIRIMLERAKSANDINMQLIIALCCLAGGLRRSELVGLRWEDIKLDEKESYIHVQRAVIYEKTKMIVKETKTKAGNRIIPIQANGTVYNILLSARKLYLKEQSENSDFDGQNHVFILHKAPFTPVTAKKIYKIYVNFLKNECPELPQYRLHDLRHTYFTWCSEIEGFSELSIIGTGGHSTIQSSKRYQHATMERMRSDMGKLETAFINAKSTG